MHVPGCWEDRTRDTQGVLRRGGCKEVVCKLRFLGYKRSLLRHGIILSPFRFRFPFSNFEHPPPTIFQVVWSSCLAAGVPLRAHSGLSGCGSVTPDAPGTCLDPVSQQTLCPHEACILGARWASNQPQTALKVSVMGQ